MKTLPVAALLMGLAFTALSPAGAADAAPAFSCGFHVFDATAQATATVTHQGLLLHATYNGMADAATCPGFPQLHGVSVTFDQTMLLRREGNRMVGGEVHIVVDLVVREPMVFRGQLRGTSQRLGPDTVAFVWGLVAMGDRGLKLRDDHQAAVINTSTGEVLSFVTNAGTSTLGQ